MQSNGRIQRSLSLKGLIQRALISSQKVEKRGFLHRSQYLMEAKESALAKQLEKQAFALQARTFLNFSILK